MAKVPTTSLAFDRGRRAFLRRGGLAAGWLLARTSRAAEVEASLLQRIRDALPDRAMATPLRPRRLLIFDRNVGYGGHPSIPTANLAFTEMGRRTGAYQAEVHHDPEVFRPESLRGFDAVFFNNNVGNLFTDPGLRQSLVDFVYGGGGMMGVHGATVAFTQWPGATEDWPEYARMIGARGANHRDSDEHVFIKLDDPDHPVVRTFEGRGFDYRDEFFRVHAPYSRDRVRVLLSIDTDKTDLVQGAPRGQVEREDNDYALAWLRRYGRGRTFYCTIAHNPYVFWDPGLLRFYLDATQFALGDLPAPTQPSNRLSPTVRAREKVGWRPGIHAHALPALSLFETIDEAARLGLSYLGGSRNQTVGRDIDKPLAPGLTDDELRAVRFKLDDAGVRMPTYNDPDLSGDESACRRVFDFARRMGIETLVTEFRPEALDAIERLSDTYDIRVAFHGSETSPKGGDPRTIREACAGRSRWLGACADLGAWQRAGLDPAEGLRLLGDRVQTVIVDTRNPERTESLLRELHSLDVDPTMIALQSSNNGSIPMREIEPWITMLDRVCLSLAGEDPT